MGKYQSAMKKAANAKPLNNFAPPIGLGKHRVALKHFRGKEGGKSKEVFVEAEFIIMESETETIGAVRGWPWFINAKGWSGEYNASRMQEFLAATAAGVGDERPLDEIGDELSDEEQNPGYGILTDVEVVQVPDKEDPRKVMLRANGQEVHNSFFYPVEGQDEASILATQAKMGEYLAKKTATAPAVAKAETAQTQESATRAADAAPLPVAKVVETPKTGGIRKLLGR